MSDTEPEELTWIEVLDRADCWRRLASEPVGRVAFVDDDHARVLPVNYAVDEDTLVFRTYSLFADAVSPVPIELEADRYDEQSRTGWSVIVRGSLERVVAPEQVARCEQTGLLGWAPGERNHWFRLVPVRVTGRAIGRRPVADPDVAS